MLFSLHSILLFGGFVVVFLRQGLAMSPRRVCSGTTMAHCNLCLQDSSDSHASASSVAGTIGVSHHSQLTFAILVETGFHHVGQAGLGLLVSSDTPALASQSAEIIGIRPLHPALNLVLIIMLKLNLM